MYVAVAVLLCVALAAAAPAQVAAPAVAPVAEERDRRAAAINHWATPGSLGNSDFLITMGWNFGYSGMNDFDLVVNCMIEVDGLPEPCTLSNKGASQGYCGSEWGMATSGDAKANFEYNGSPYYAQFNINSPNQGFDGTSSSNPWPGVEAIYMNSMGPGVYKVLVYDSCTTAMMNNGDAAGLRVMLFDKNHPSKTNYVGSWVMYQQSQCGGRYWHVFTLNVTNNSPLTYTVSTTNVINNSPMLSFGNNNIQDFEDSYRPTCP